MNDQQAPQTVSSGCAPFDKKRCTSCSQLPTPYDRQLRLKVEKLKASFVAAGYSRLPVAAMEGVGNGFHSRNKAKMAVGGSAEYPVLGYVRKDKMIAELSDCPLCLEPIEKVLEVVRAGISEQRLFPYAIQKDKGELKYVIVRASEATGEISVRLVLRSKDQLAQATSLLNDLQKHIPLVVVTSINIQPMHTAIIEGKEEIIISARKTVTEKYGELLFPLGPQSFSQVTSSVALKLYQLVQEKARRGVSSPVLDLFCGIGTFSLFCAKDAAYVVGIERSAAAIENAKAAAALNGIKNCIFHARDVEEYLSATTERFPTVVVNPPRRGLSANIITQLKKAASDTILYSSCNPESLMRDLDLLSDTFAPLEAYPFDMFPHTDHIETVVVLKRR